MNSQDFHDFYKGKKILVTGHTGFKGGWLCAWLKKLGADVIGFSLPPAVDRPSLFDAAHIKEGMTSLFGDIRDLDQLHRVFKQHQPVLVFHLAAQALVRRSYYDPVTTYATNVLGTVHVLEAARACSSVNSVLVVTSDKCYQNNEWTWGYREIDPLGGKDPYSSSKACAELVVKAYQESILRLDGRIHLASARGGNVIGGGDWAEDRLIPDIVNALQTGQEIILRNPTAVRPWQHVLELIRGYLTLVPYLATEGKTFVGAWNFGPNKENEVTVECLTRKFITMWGASDSSVRVVPSTLREANFLRLDASKAEKELDWHPMLGIDESIGLTVKWYRDWSVNPTSAAKLVEEQISSYMAG